MCDIPRVLVEECGLEIEGSKRDGITTRYRLKYTRVPLRFEALYKSGSDEYGLVYVQREIRGMYVSGENYRIIALPQVVAEIRKNGECRELRMYRGPGNLKEMLEKHHQGEFIDPGNLELIAEAFLPAK